MAATAVGRRRYTPDIPRSHSCGRWWMILADCSVLSVPKTGVGAGKLVRHRKSWRDVVHANNPSVIGRNRPWSAGQAAVRSAPAPVSGTFSFVPDSGIRAAAFRPACTLGTVAFTSVIGRP